MKSRDPAAASESCPGSMLLRWMPRSLRGRLLVALLVVLLSFWAVWFGCQSMMLNRQQTGWWDSSLRLIAQQILLSLPDNVDQVTTASRSFRLPPGEKSAADTPLRRMSLAERAFRGEKASFQVWTRSGQSAFRSPGAPTVPLRADFQDGLPMPRSTATRGASTASATRAAASSCRSGARTSSCMQSWRAGSS